MAIVHFVNYKKPQTSNGMLYAGYLFCGECGQKLYLHRCKSLTPEKNFFQCGGYQTKGGAHCTAHYIREQMLDEIILGRVKKMTALARETPEEFYAMATENGEAEAKKFYSMAERQKSSLESRMKGIDKIIRCLYEDRVVGRISPERYDELASSYELEQAEIKQELESISAKIAEMDMREICIKEFIAKAKEYVDMDNLIPDIIRAFILRIDVYKKEEKFSRKCGNYIEIHHTFQPKPRTTSKTAVSTIASDTDGTANSNNKCLKTAVTGRHYAFRLHTAPFTPLRTTGQFLCAFSCSKIPGPVSPSYGWAGMRSL